MRFFLSFLFFCLSVNICFCNGEKFVDAKVLAEQNAAVEYIKIKDEVALDLPTFPLSGPGVSSWNKPIIPEVFILTAKNARVFSEQGIALINGQAINELVWPWSRYKRNPDSLDLSKLPIVQKVGGRVLVIAQEGCRNYYHWMLEVLPKLALIEQSRMTYDKIYLPNVNLPFVHKTLDMLGIKQEKIVWADNQTHIQADELILPSFVSKSCYTPKWVADWLKSKFITKVDNKKTDFSKKIFISRKNAACRRILNEDEIFNHLKAQGFGRYFLEDLDVEDQIKLFMNADVIIAPHGAGLTNTVFCKPGTKIIEIFQQRADDAYWFLSQVLGFKHHCIKSAEFTDENGGNQDTVVSWEKIAAALEGV